MRALGVALAACCAVVLWPSALHANPIGARDAAERTKLDTVPGWEAFDGDQDADDGMFTAQAGLDHSVHFAATGAIEAFDDDHISLGNIIDSEGLSTASHELITVGLLGAPHGGDNDGDDQGTPPVEHAVAPAPSMPHGPKLTDPPGIGGTGTSATPEPASMLLLATGLAGVILYRRRLIA